MNRFLAAFPPAPAVARRTRGAAALLTGRRALSAQLRRLASALGLRPPPLPVPAHAAVRP